jgi:glycosyltransferase involved in cell wall biosynthesis
VFSVVVPTFNRADVLGQTLESLRTQEGDISYEVVVVDNNSSDNTGSVARDFQARSGGLIRYVFEGEQGSSAARNAGTRSARGTVVAFVDDDVIAGPGWLQAMAEIFGTHPDAWCVGGRVVLRLPDALPRWFDSGSDSAATYLSRLDYGDATLRITGPRGLITANLAVRRDALIRLGGFKTSLGRFGDGLLCGEDTELCQRIQRSGGGVYYCGRAAVFHLVPEWRLTKRFLRGRAYWEGRTDGVLLADTHASPSFWRLGREGVTLVKDCARALASHAAGEPRRAFEHELAAYKRWGYIRQIAWSAAVGRTSAVPASGR